MTWSDVKRVQQSVSCEDKDIPSLRSDSWIHVTISDAQIHKPKQARTEIYIRELPEVEADEDNIFKGKNKKKIHDIKLGISLFNLIKKNSEEEELFAYSQEETEEEEEEEEEEEVEDEELSRIFMSNIKDEKPVNRIGLNIRQAHYKGLAYYKLYRKDYMSIIGPEVFERATKLRKVTSLSLPKIMPKTTSTNNSSIMSNANLQPEPSGENLSEKNENSRENVDISPGIQLTGENEEKLKSTEIKESEFETKPYASIQSDQEKLPPYLKTQPSQEETVEVQKPRPPCYKKRRITIKWIGNLKNNLMECDSASSSFSNKSDDFSDFQKTREADSEEDTPPEEMKISHFNVNISPAKTDESNEKYTTNRDVYFLMELLHKPLPEILGKYYDLKNIAYTRRKPSSMYKKEFEHTDNLYGMYFLKRFEEMRATGGNDYKVWKSKVLKIAEANQEPITGDFLNKIDKDVVNKLLRYQYVFLKSKTKENNSNISMMSLQVDGGNIKNNRGQCLIQLSTSKSKNELCCRSHSENILQSREILKEDNNNIIYSNKRNFSETPSEHSIEVCHKDLNNGQLDNSEQARSPFEDFSKDELKTSEEFHEIAEDGSLCSEESDEPISLYYSKAANLASPLLDMKKFIYPDHIHYSYKHVNKKGFDVNISGDLPLLVQSQALAKNKNLHVKKVPAKPEPEITKRPMDLSFAKTNAFADWQNSDQNVSDFPTQSNANFNAVKIKPSTEETKKRKKGSSKKKGKNSERNSQNGTSLDSHHVYFTQTSIICEKLSNESSEKDKGRSPVQISSTQLHSNKGRISSTYNPALRLQENKREGKKKVDAQEKHAKDMLATMEKGIFFQQKWL